MTAWLRVVLAAVAIVATMALGWSAVAAPPPVVEEAPVPRASGFEEEVELTIALFQYQLDACFGTSGQASADARADVRVALDAMGRVVDTSVEGSVNTSAETGACVCQVFRSMSFQQTPREGAILHVPLRPSSADGPFEAMTITAPIHPDVRDVLATSSGACDAFASCCIAYADAMRGFPSMDEQSALALEAACVTMRRLPDDPDNANTCLQALDAMRIAGDTFETMPGYSWPDACP